MGLGNMRLRVDKVIKHNYNETTPHTDHHGLFVDVMTATHRVTHPILLLPEMRHFLLTLTALGGALSQDVTNGTGALSLPNPRDCANRIKHAQHEGHNYFFSWEYDLTKDIKVDWITGRNICRRHCMDLVSIETREENEFVKKRMINGLIRFFWTSGRKCNFDGCDREDLQPPIVNGECEV